MTRYGLAVLADKLGQLRQGMARQAVAEDWHRFLLNESDLNCPSE